mmetsp:Transcript_21243/g.44637  ORF Transcript_21243/g.44637 Transcript_21243/m.44637 type:complete len:238 (-) Transcript_21243:701-1414(-)
MSFQRQNIIIFQSPFRGSFDSDSVVIFVFSSILFVRIVVLFLFHESLDDIAFFKSFGCLWIFFLVPFPPEEWGSDGCRIVRFHVTDFNLTNHLHGKWVRNGLLFRHRSNRRFDVVIEIFGPGISRSPPSFVFDNIREQGQIVKIRIFRRRYPVLDVCVPRTLPFLAVIDEDFLSRLNIPRGDEFQRQSRRPFLFQEIHRFVEPFLFVEEIEIGGPSYFGIVFREMMIDVGDIGAVGE